MSRFWWLILNVDSDRLWSEYVCIRFFAEKCIGSVCTLFLFLKDRQAHTAKLDVYGYWRGRVSPNHRYGDFLVDLKRSYRPHLQLIRSFQDRLISYLNSMGFLLCSPDFIPYPKRNEDILNKTSHCISSKIVWRPAVTSIHEPRPVALLNVRYMLLLGRNDAVAEPGLADWYTRRLDWHYRISTSSSSPPFPHTQDSDVWDLQFGSAEKKQCQDFRSRTRAIQANLGQWISCIGNHIPLSLLVWKGPNGCGWTEQALIPVENDLSRNAISRDKVWYILLLTTFWGSNGAWATPRTAICRHAGVVRGIKVVVRSFIWAIWIEVIIRAGVISHYARYNSGRRYQEKELRLDVEAWFSVILLLLYCTRPILRSSRCLCHCSPCLQDPCVYVWHRDGELLSLAEFF